MIPILFIFYLFYLYARELGIKNSSIDIININVIHLSKNLLYQFKSGQIDIAWEMRYSIIDNRIITRTKTVLDSVTDRFSEHHLTSITLSFVLSRFYDLFVSPFSPFPTPCTVVSLNFSSPVSKLSMEMGRRKSGGEEEGGRYLFPRAYT